MAYFVVFLAVFAAISVCFDVVVAVGNVSCASVAVVYAMHEHWPCWYSASV